MDEGAGAEALAKRTKIAHETMIRQRAAGKGGSSSVMLLVVGVLLMAIGVGAVVARSWAGAAGGMLVGLPLFAFGFSGNRSANRRADRAAWIYEHGDPRTARVVSAEYTGRTNGDHAEHRLDLEIVGPKGPYAAHTNHWFPRHEISGWMGRDLKVVVDPKIPTDFVLELPLPPALARVVEDGGRARRAQG